MAEVRDGIRSILRHPIIYNLSQSFLSAGRERFADLYIGKPARVLDIGCGTGTILDVLDERCEYFGFDVHEPYIRWARQRYRNRPGTRFENALVTEADVANGKRVDFCLAKGVLHHLDDQEAMALFRLARKALGDSGRLVTIDPCKIPHQYPFAGYLVSRDRGQNVRAPEEYAALARGCFSRVELHVHHDLLRLPYTHAVLVCSP